MQPAVLFGLLGATIVAAVSSMPADNRNYNEEMVTRCIIEVLSNALLKSNAPPITPECRQILQKSRKEVKDEEKSENENTRFEVRLLRASADASEANRPPSREDPGVPGEEDTQGPSVASTEGGGHSREVAGEPQGSLRPSDGQVSNEAKTLHSEKSEGEAGEEEEGEKYQNSEHAEGGREEKRPEEPGDTHMAFPDRRSQAAAGTREELASRSGTQPAGLPEERAHSRETSSQESREETRDREEQPPESRSRSGSQEESEDSEEDASREGDRRRSRPGQQHGPGGPGRAFRGRGPPSAGRGQPREESEEPDVGLAGLGAERGRSPAHFGALEGEPEHGGEGRSYARARAPGPLQGERHGGRGSEKHAAPRPSSDEGQEEEGKRSRPASGLDRTAPGYGGEGEDERGPEWGHRHRAGGGEPEAYSPPDGEEKRLLGGGRHRVPENRLDEARRRLQGEWEDQDRHYNYGEDDGGEGARGPWPRREDPQDAEGSREDRQYGPHRTSAKRKRLGELLSPYYAPSQWKSGPFERKDSMADNFLDGDEEDGLALSEKNFFPEYSYDWWEKKPLEEDVNWGYEDRQPAPGLDPRRRYDGAAELDRLLHFRKKAAEFPGFYDSASAGPLSPRRAADIRQDGAGPGVLAEEEEKELENLAAMDLELQKIAEKFSNRRG